MLVCMPIKKWILSGCDIYLCIQIRSKMCLYIIRIDNVKMKMCMFEHTHILVHPSSFGYIKLYN